eukprot:1151639-Pelagomonas_calceolata.AAC.2
MPILMIKVERILLKRASGASKFQGVLGSLSMKLQSKLDGFSSINTKIFEGIQSVGGVDGPAHT